MSETPCQPSQPESGHPRTDPADIATDRGTSNPEQGTTGSKRAEVSPFSHPARNAEAQDATSEAETAPEACQRADNCPHAVVTLPDTTPSENGVSGAMKTRLAPDGQFIPLGMEWSEQEQRVVPMQLVREEPAPGLNPDDADEIPVTMSQIGLPKHYEITKRANAVLDEWAKEYGEAARKVEGFTPVSLGEVMRACNIADDKSPATGTEAQVCRDIAKRQRRGLAKYGKTVIGNPLSFAQWLQHFYEELLDGAVYAKRILTQMNHEPENENQDDAGTAGVLHRDSPPHHGISEPVPLRTPAGAGNDSDFCPGPVARHRKPGAGRKPKPCPNCGAVKSIGSTVKNGIPTRRCKQCGFVVRQYHHLANGKTAAEMA